MTMSDDIGRHRRASHAMQSGVAYSKDKTDQEPKHLRVGINVALSDQAGLARLLIDKGIITDEEYAKALADEMEREVERYEANLSEQYGAEIKLR